MWLPDVMTSTPEARIASAVDGVRPIPPATFSPLAVTKSMPRSLAQLRQQAARPRPGRACRSCRRSSARGTRRAAAARRRWAGCRGGCVRSSSRSIPHSRSHRSRGLSLPDGRTYSGPDAREGVGAGDDRAGTRPITTASGTRRTDRARLGAEGGSSETPLDPLPSDPDVGDPCPRVRRPRRGERTRRARLARAEPVPRLHRRQRGRPDRRRKRACTRTRRSSRGRRSTPRTR